MRHRRGFMLMDAIGAIVIVAALGLAMLHAMRGYRAAMAELNHGQQAITLAETTLAKLQAGQAPPPGDDDTTITIKRLDEGHLMPGRRWVRVRVVHHGHEAELIGTAPGAALRGGGS